MSNVSFLAEGPAGKRLTWLGAVRKSYLQYLIGRTSDEPGLAFGFWDAQGKVTAKVSGRQQLSLNLLRAYSGLDRSEVLARLGANSPAFSDYDSSLAIGTWRWTPTRAAVSSRIAWLGEEYGNTNRDRRVLGRGRYREAIWNGDAGWTWTPRVVTEGGWSVRAVQDEGGVNQVVGAQTRALERWASAARRSGVYVQQTWASRGGMEARVGGRWDHHEFAPGAVYTPYAAVVAPLPGRVRLSLSWSQATQFGEIRQYLSPLERSWPAERSQHAELAVERMLGERSRLRLEVFERRDRDLLWRPAGDAPLVNARVTPGLLPAPWENTLRGRVRGGQVMWQRRSANGWNGWIAYTYAPTSYEDRRTGARFVSDFELRHQAQAFLSYRLRPTLNLSGRFVWASGLPVRGYFEQRGAAEFFAAAERNRVRLPDYQRTDLRVNKVFVKRRVQTTLFAEVINLTNRRNVRIEDIGTTDVRTGRTRISILRTFPILPSVGVVFDFQ
jgi:hypothetical protein